MKRVILDDDLKAKLNGLNQMVEICAPTGETVGQFVPQDKFLKLLAVWDEQTISTEELRRRAARPGGKPLAAIMQQLEDSQACTK